MVSVGLWGQRRKSFLQEHRPTFYNELLLEGRLNCYLVDINEQTQARYDLLLEQMKEHKAESPWEWISLMNNIAACTREDVNAEIILA